jgi:hypothetical protein
VMAYQEWQHDGFASTFPFEADPNPSLPLFDQPLDLHIGIGYDVGSNDQIALKLRALFGSAGVGTQQSYSGSAAHDLAFGHGQLCL